MEFYTRKITTAYPWELPHAALAYNGRPMGRRYAC